MRETLRFGERLGTRLIVIDSYSISNDFLRHLKKLGWFVACIDDHVRQCPDVDLVVNGNVGAEELDYPCTKQTRLLLGPKYSLLRREFHELREGLGVLPIKPLVENVLVGFGGSDPHEQTARVLRLLEGIPEPFSVDVLITSYYRNPTTVQSLAGRSKRKIRLVYEPARVGHAMRRCDLAITAASTMGYELACLGVPFLVMKLYENQRFVYHHLVRKQIAVAGGKLGVQSDRLVVRQFRRLFRSYQLRVSLQQKATQTIDGLGAERVADVLCSAFERFQRAALQRT